MLQRVVWLTDVHLNFLPHDDAVRFALHVAQQDPAAVLLSGDIAESHDVIKFLTLLADSFTCPLYFVLGNHDYYFSSIRAVREDVQALCDSREDLIYLTSGGVYELTPEISLVGHDGWADGRYGDYEKSYVVMHDYKLIEELAPFNKRDRWEVLKRLGDEAAEAVGQNLLQALQQYDEAFLLTHIPPLLEACWHQGEISDSQWSPHFTCKAVGMKLLEIMRAHPQKRLTVLCGHTHGSGRCRPLDNLRVLTGGAEYGRPGVTEIFEL